MVVVAFKILEIEVEIRKKLIITYEYVYHKGFLVG